MSDHNTVLALAIIAQARIDLQTYRRGPLREAALEWVASDGFEATCLEADVCPKKIRRMWKEQGVI